MIRKSFFWGLTLVFVVALVSLILRGCHMEKQQSAKPDEIVQQSQSSPTKVLRPEDLQIVSSTMQRGNSRTAHEIEIRNNGIVRYSGIQLAFTYLNQAGKVLLKKTHVLDGVSIPPGSSFTARNVSVEGVPASAAKLQVSILSADMLPEGH